MFGSIMLLWNRAPCCLVVSSIRYCSRTRRSMSRYDIIAKIPGDEALRLAAIERYKLSGIGREAAFDRIARLTASLFEVPVSLVSIVGSEMQCFRGACGLDVSGTPR